MASTNSNDNNELPQQQSTTEKRVRRTIFQCIISILVISTLVSQSFYLEGLSLSTFLVDDDETVVLTEDAAPTAVRRLAKKIAIIASHIPSSQTADSSRVKLLDHILNKACYAHLWGYDFIFNMTPGFTKNDTHKAPWLEFGTWHRVPHIASRIADYDWILYADVDYVFADMSRPIESFLREFELYGKDPSIFVPVDMPCIGGKCPEHLQFFTFSAFAVMIKNSPFGRTVVNNWLDFGRDGVCPNGNIPQKFDTNGKLIYGWEHSDQPGIWYSLVKTHRQFFYPNELNNITYCNKTTGYLQTDRCFGPELNTYFKSKKAVTGHEGEHLANVPKQQPIIWSNDPSEGGNPLNGLGYQMTFNVEEDDTKHQHAFALHKKNKMSADFHRELELCKTVHGCYANYTKDGRLQIGCNGTEFAVPIGAWT